MEPDRVVHIALEVRLAGDELTGSAATRDGAERPFHGWLGLVAALDALVAACAAAPSPPGA